MRRAWGWSAVVVTVVLAVTGCQQSGSTKPSPTGSASVAPSSSASPAPGLTIVPATGTTGVRPDAQVVVTAEHGTVDTVTVTSAKGATVAGEAASDGTSWHSTAALTAGTDYTVTAVVKGADGATTTKSSSFTTLTPSSTASVILVPGDDWTVGVGMPVVVQFSRTVKNRDAAVKALTVTTTPQVEGAWHWMNAQSVWWRPKEYWPSGTKVEVKAAIDQAELAPGVWGKRTYTSRFTIGDRVISTVDVKAHTLTVTKDDKVVRVIPVTTGQDTDRYRTRGGIKVIMDKKPVENMDASSTGTQKDSPEYYNLNVKWAMRLTWSGEYLHAAPWSVGSQGRANVSHGCTGMSTENAKWMFDFSKIGDVVVYKNSSRPLEPGNGYTAWELSWDQWSAGSSA